MLSSVESISLCVSPRQLHEKFQLTHDLVSLSGFAKICSLLHDSGREIQKPNQTSYIPLILLTQSHAGHRKLIASLNLLHYVLWATL